MIGGLSVLAIVPARGGSKALPGKNILPGAGRPLLAWTIAAARGSAYLDRIVLSSDAEEIMAAARGLGCEVPFRRTDDLASDTASTIDVVIDALDRLPRHDLVVVLQPTSPLRTAADIDAALGRCVDSGAPSCVSVSPVEQSPYWMYQVDDAGRLRPLLDGSALASRRQELPPIYILNGAVYAARTDWLRATRHFVGAETVAYPMPADRALDIDTAEDFEVFRRLVERSGQLSPAALSNP